MTHTPSAKQKKVFVTLLTLHGLDDQRRSLPLVQARPMTGFFCALSDSRPAHPHERGRETSRLARVRKGTRSH